MINPITSLRKLISLSIGARTQGSWLMAIVAMAVLANPAYAQSYRVLLSNDDGIDSPLLADLKKELDSLEGVEVVLSAPRDNQSGASQSSSGGELKVERVMRDGEFFGYGVFGKPADAVRFGLAVLGKDEPFDLVVSGINRGANVGDVSHLSGTVGAAMEGVYQGVPAIAVSQEVQGADSQVSAGLVSKIIQRYRRDGAPQGIVLSINVPAGEIKGVHVKSMGDSYIDLSAYAAVENPADTSGDYSYYSRETQLQESTNNETDTWSYQQGYITLTPLKFDWTAHDLIPEIEAWNLSQ